MQTPFIHPAYLDNLTQQVCTHVFVQGPKAVYLFGAGVQFRDPTDVDAKSPAFVGVFDERAGTQGVREAIQFTVNEMHAVRL